MTAAAVRPESPHLYDLTHPEAIRTRVDLARRVMELQDAEQVAEGVRDALAVFLADQLADDGPDQEAAVTEYRKARAALIYAQAARQQASDELRDYRRLAV